MIGIAGKSIFIGKTITDPVKLKNLDEKIRVAKGLIYTASVTHKVLLAFSGGKDSIVSAFLSKEFNIKDAVCEESFCTDRQKRDFRIVAKHLSLNCDYKDSLSLEWLGKNPKWVLTPISKQSAFYALRQQATVKRYAKKHGYTAILYGRRTQENTVKSSLYKTADGVTQIHPLRDFTTEEVWHIIHTHKIPYPDIYNHVIGDKEGNTPVNILPPEHFADPWAVLYDYEPSMVEKFATVNKGAKKWLENL